MSISSKLKGVLAEAAAVAFVGGATAGVAFAGLSVHERIASALPIRDGMSPVHHTPAENGGMAGLAGGGAAMMLLLRRREPSDPQP